MCRNAGRGQGFVFLALFLVRYEYFSNDICSHRSSCKIARVTVAPEVSLRMLDPVGRDLVKRIGDRTPRAPSRSFPSGGRRRTQGTRPPRVTDIFVAFNVRLVDRDVWHSNGVLVS